MQPRTYNDRSDLRVFYSSVSVGYKTMENEVDELGDPLSPVKISVTRPSVSDDDDGQEINDDNGPSSETIDGNGAESDIRTDDGENDVEKGQQDEIEKKSDESDSVADAVQNGVKLDESDGKSGKGPTLEMVGDRVLIERDGKFELVDASEIKAEYFEMLGLEKGKLETDSSERKSEYSETSEDKSSTSLIEDTSDNVNTVLRPKTSGMGRTSPTSFGKKSPTRSYSAKPSRRNDEYSYIKSRYAMTEQQLEIKRKREEAIARRKKEEEERAMEEHRRKREDAERAFEAWLMAKDLETKEQRKQAEKNKPDPNVPIERAKSAQQAYEEWIKSKRKQEKMERDLEKSRKEEEAAGYLVRDRELCDEAFKRWLRKKCSNSRAKAAKKKKSKKLKKKEPIPLNSDQIRYYEYYGYRNSVAL